MPGYKESGKKIVSRFGMSHRNGRDCVKRGIIPSSNEYKSMGRDPTFSAKQWRRQNRMSLRQLRVFNKSLPMYDMDGSYFY
jgi:hypothetical protein